MRLCKKNEKYQVCLLAGQSAVGRLTFHLLNQYDQTGTQDFDFQYLLNDQPLFKKEIAISTREQKAYWQNAILL